MKSTYPVSEQCIGDSMYCLNGYTVSMWLFIKPTDVHGYVFSLWNDQNGFAVHYERLTETEVNVTIAFREDDLQQNFTLSHRTYRWFHLAFARYNSHIMTFWLNGDEQNAMEETDFLSSPVGVGGSTYLVFGANGEYDPPTQITSSVVFDEFYFREGIDATSIIQAEYGKLGSNS